MEARIAVSENQVHLFQTRRFLPLFVTQFLGALNDNFFKNALVILILYRLAEVAGLDGQILEEVFVKTHLAAHEYPREVEFVASLPLTATGKIMRKDLRARDSG